MNLLDIAILVLLALFALYGYYRGFFHALLSIGAYALSCALALAFMGAVSNAFKQNETVYNMMLYYTEGSEYVEDVELAGTSIQQVSNEDLAAVAGNEALPYPIGRAIGQNIATEAFASLGVTTVGDYFNQTIVRVFLNILSFLLLFGGLRLLLIFLINGAQYTREFPMLRHSDRFIGAGFGLLRGILFLFPLMMVIPIVLTVLPFDFINELILHSFFAPFFYQSNFLLALIPGI